MGFFKLLIPIIIALSLMIIDHKLSLLQRARHAIGTILSPIYLVVDLPTQLFTWINEQSSSKDKLLSDNRNLREKLLKLKSKTQTLDALQLENKKIKKLLDAHWSIKQNKLILAKVNTVSQSRLKKQLLINKGSNDGVQLGQVALGALGIVGQISQITLTHATISMASDPTQYVPVKNARNGIQGISKGVALNKNTLKVNFIDMNADIKLGDTFVSSALGEKFPEGHPLGKVILVEQPDNESFLRILLEPIQNTQQLDFVIIVSQP